MAMNNYRPTSHTMQDGAVVNGLSARSDREATEREEALVAQAGMEAVVEIRDLTKTYKLGQTKVRALRGVSLAVQRGEFVAIMGPSGSGKLTLRTLVGSMDRPTSGEDRLTGKIGSKMPADELADIRNQQIGFVFQGFNLLARATALKNVVLPLMYAGLSGQEQLRRARKVLQLVGLGARMNHKPAELSGGQQQRVAIARALVNNPALLLADEPTGNLDSHTSLEILTVLQALNQRGLTIMLVTHEADIAAYAKRQVVFRDGRIVRDEVVAAPRSAQADWLASRQTRQAPQVTQVERAEESEESKGIEEGSSHA